MNRWPSRHWKVNVAWIAVVAVVAMVAMVAMVASLADDQEPADPDLTPIPPPRRPSTTAADRGICGDTAELPPM